MATKGDPIKVISFLLGVVHNLTINSLTKLSLIGLATCVPLLLMVSIYEIWQKWIGDNLVATSAVTATVAESEKNHNGTCLAHAITIDDSDDETMKPTITPVPPRKFTIPLVAGNKWLLVPGSVPQGPEIIPSITLSVVTTELDLWAFLSELPALRHLALQHVALLPTGGSWESVFRKFHEGLELQTIQLAMLEDAALTDDRKHMIPRAVLRPTEDIWKDCPEQARCYQSHEDAVVDYVLGHSTLLPSLSPEALRHSHA